MLSKFQAMVKIGDEIIDLTKSKSDAARAMHACLVYLEKEAIRYQMAEVAHFLGVAADATVDAVHRLERKDEQVDSPNLENDVASKNPSKLN